MRARTLGGGKERAVIDCPHLFDDKKGGHLGPFFVRSTTNSLIVLGQLPVIALVILKI